MELTPDEAYCLRMDTDWFERLAAESLDQQALTLLMTCDEWRWLLAVEPDASLDEIHTPLSAYLALREQANALWSRVDPEEQPPPLPAANPSVPMAMAELAEWLGDVLDIVPPEDTDELLPASVAPQLCKGARAMLGFIAKGPHTNRRLMERLESRNLPASKRTVQRYFDALRQAGLVDGRDLTEKGRHAARQSTTTAEPSNGRHSGPTDGFDRASK